MKKNKKMLSFKPWTINLEEGAMGKICDEIKYSNKVKTDMIL